MRKERRSFNIGIFTVFLCVMTITFFASTTAITPILFINNGQQAAGTIDIAILPTSKDSSYLKGNVNFYNINQFDNPFHPTVEQDPQQAAASDCQPCQSACFNRTECIEQVSKFVQVHESSIEIINGNFSMSLLRTDYFMDRLGGLEGYNGFFPRVLLPAVKMYNNRKG